MAKLSPNDRRLGEILLHRKLLDPPRLQHALDEAPKLNLRLGAYLVAQEWITPEDLRDAVALQANLPTADLRTLEFPEALNRIFPYRALKDHRCVPFEETPSYVCLAIAEPLKLSAVRELEYGCRRPVKLFVAQERLVDQCRDKLYEGRIPRQFTRFKATIPVELQFCTRIGTPIEEAIRTVTTVDISQGGLGVLGLPRVPSAIPERRPKDVYAQVTLKDPEYEVQAVCQVRWLREAGGRADGLEFLAGLEVVEIRPQDQQRLLQLCVKYSRA